MKTGSRKLITPLAVAIGTFLFSSLDASAGSKEIAAINAELAASGDTISSATSTELANAVVAAINNNTNLKPGVIAGEALKGAGSNAPDAGMVIGQTVDAANIASVEGTVSARQKFTADAAKTASSNPVHVPEFASEFVTDNADAIATAKLTRNSKVAVGTIIGGRALDADVDTEQERLDLANAAISDPKLKGAAQEIARFVGDTTTNAPGFATALSALQINLLTKIAPGVTASNPDQGAEIIDNLFNTSSTGATTVKNAAKLAKSMGLVADTEEAQHIGREIGERISSGLIAIKQLNKVASALVKSIIKKPVIDPIADTNNNKFDEIGEVAAYILNAAIQHPDFDVTTKAPKLVVGLIKTVVKAAKLKKSVDATNFFQTEAADDVPGSVALTINSLQANSALATGVFDAIRTLLLNPKTAKKIGGTKLAPTIAAALAKGIDNTGNASTIYEDGTQPILGVINEPETDNRNG